MLIIQEFLTVYTLFLISSAHTYSETAFFPSDDLGSYALFRTVNFPLKRLSRVPLFFTKELIFVLINSNQVTTQHKSFEANNNHFFA